MGDGQIFLKTGRDVPFNKVLLNEPNFRPDPCRWTVPLMSSLLVIFVRGGEAICRFWIWSEIECKTPAEYGPQYISTPPPPPSHTLSVYTVHWEGEEGEGGQREGKYRGNSTKVKYSSFFHGGNSSQAGSKLQTMSECISSLWNLLNRMPQSLLTGQLKEKLT